MKPDQRECTLDEHPLHGSTGRPVALITGASGGIGSAMAEVAAERGFDLLLVSLPNEGLTDIGQFIAKQTGVLTAMLEVDLSTSVGVEKVISEIQRHDISIQLLVNVAGYGIVREVNDTSIEDQLGMIRVNAEAVVHLTGALLPSMIQRGSGLILNVGSIVSYSPMPGCAVYAGTKAFILNWSESLAHEVAKHGVKVTVLCPGSTASNFYDRAGTSFPDYPAWYVRAGGLLDSRSVALAGMNALEAGQSVVMPGVINKATNFVSRFFPRRVLANSSDRLNKKLFKPRPFGNRSCVSDTDI